MSGATRQDEIDAARGEPVFGHRLVQQHGLAEPGPGDQRDDPPRPPSGERPEQASSHQMIGIIVGADAWRTGTVT